MDALRVEPLVQAMAEGEVVNRDGLPRGTFASMRLFSQTVSPPVARMLRLLDRVPASAYVAGAIALIGGLLSVQGLRKKPLYVGFAATSTGFAGMVMSVVLILVFQVQYGDVYQYVGALTALFMLGAAAGSAWAARLGGGPLLVIESGLLLTLSLAYGCAVWAPPAEIWLGMIFLLMVLTGLMTGAQYPVLVARLRGGDRRIGFPAGRIYVLDLAGAVLGAALAGIVLLPTIGLARTILLMAVVKAGSLLLILAWQRKLTSPA
jgi:spermidine synthase